METDCVFCKIVAGSIPATKVYEDEHVIAFPDIRPKAPGHTLLISKEHYAWFYELPDELSDHMFRVSKKLAIELKAKHDAHLVKLSIVGDQVPHVHFHLIPFPKTETPQI